MSIEKDPNGLDSSQPGSKLDSGKPMASLLKMFGLALLEIAKVGTFLEIAKVGTFGAEKYSRGGWEHVENGEERYDDAMWRHLLKEHLSECDPDSGFLHEAHAAWNALARLELKLRPTGHVIIQEEIGSGIVETQHIPDIPDIPDIPKWTMPVGLEVDIETWAGRCGCSREES